MQKDVLGFFYALPNIGKDGHCARMTICLQNSKNLGSDREQGKTLNRVFFLSDRVELRKLCYETVLYGRLR